MSEPTHQSEHRAFPEHPPVFSIRLSILLGLIGNSWTLYFLVYYGFTFFGFSVYVSVPLAFLAALAALVEPILMYFATGSI